MLKSSIKLGEMKSGLQAGGSTISVFRNAQTDKDEKGLQLTLVVKSVTGLRD